MRLVSASAKANQYGVTPKALTIKEISALVKKHAEAAKRCQEASFDCVDIHAAHGYLLSKFLSPFTNVRTDRYGGSVENRARFLCEIIQEIKNKCGKEFPVIIKIPCQDQMAHAENGLTFDDIKIIVRLLEKAGADELHVSVGQSDLPVWPVVGLYMQPMGLFVEQTAKLKQLVDIPVGVINGITDPLFAEQILQDGKADTIWMARPLMADPELPNKAADGRLDEIRKCIRCGVCVDMQVGDWLRDHRCTVNPELCRERELAVKEKTVRPKKILVIGGGPAGLESARVAALLGHDVHLWEKDDKLGGQVNLAALIPQKGEFDSIIRYYSAQLKSLKVKIKLDTEATTNSVKKLNPDAVIIASGSKSLIPPIPGINRKIVVDARDVIAGKVNVGNSVVIIGGGEVGIETAHFLAVQGKKITMVVRTKMGKGMVRAVFAYAHSELLKYDTEMLTDTGIENISDNGLTIIDHAGNKRFIHADNIVLAVGAKSERSLHDALENVVPEIHLAGDCLYPGNIKSAIYQGALVGRMLDDWRVKGQSL
jgi:NADPH-dependent 2,4-dienoyl-CoA reductase/sulfur reductase-like enzyme